MFSEKPLIKILEEIHHSVLLVTQDAPALDLPIYANHAYRVKIMNLIYGIKTPEKINVSDVMQDVLLQEVMNKKSIVVKDVFGMIICKDQDVLNVKLNLWKLDMILLSE